MIVAAAACSVQTEQLEGLPGPEGAPGMDGERGMDGAPGEPGQIDTTQFMLTMADTGTSGSLAVGGDITAAGDVVTTGLDVTGTGDATFAGRVVVSNGMGDDAVLQVRRTNATAARWTALAIHDEPNSADWNLDVGNTGDLLINLMGSGADAVRIDTSNNVHITNDLTVNGMVIPSSRRLKTGIRKISSEEAKKAVAALEPVHFRYKERPHDSRVGFIAEDVPEIVATRRRDGVAPFEVVAVLTKVVQDQQRQIDALEKRLAALER